jgi:hypothetical protein
VGAIFVSRIREDPAVSSQGLRTQSHTHSCGRTPSDRGLGRWCVRVWREPVAKPESEQLASLGSFANAAPVERSTRPKSPRQCGLVYPGMRQKASDGLAEWSAAVDRSPLQQGSTPIPSTELHQELMNLNNDRVAETLGGSARRLPTSPLPTSTRGAGTPGVSSVVRHGHFLR